MTFEPDYAPASVRPSPNFGERRNGKRPDTLILHYTGMASGEAAQARLCDPASEVSAHYLVHEDGSVVQMVPEHLRAWHAGQGFWHGETDLNSCSIGIEIVNPGHDYGYRDFPDAQIQAVIGLCNDIFLRWDILPQRVLAHSDIAPSRKIDPGERFPWRHLALNGVGFFPPAIADMPTSIGENATYERILSIQNNLLAYGYGLAATGVSDAQTVTVVKAFQRHFRPARVDGICDDETAAILALLLDLLAVAGSEIS